MRKWMKVSLVATLALGTLAACGTKQDATSGNDGGGAAPAEKTKFSIALRTLAFNYVEKSPNINEDKWVKRLEEKTNADLNIVLVPHKEYEQKMVQMFATGDVADVMQGSGGVNGKEMAGSVQAGVFMPLDDLLKKSGQNLLKKIPKEAWDQVSYQGKIYAIPEYLSNPSRRATWIRKDLLDKTGLPVPKTVEETMDVLRAFKKLGVENPYMGRQDFKYADTFFGAYDVYPYLSMFEKQGDQVVPKFFDSENMQKALGVYKTMYDEGLINKEFATINPTTFKNTILAGKAGMWTMNANEILQWEAQLRASVPDAKLEIIPSPTGPDGKGGHYLYGSVTRSYFIKKDVKNAEAIVKFFDWMVSDEAETFFTFGVEGETFTTENGKIVYKSPTEPNAVDEERYRQAFLWMVQDTTYNKGSLSLTPEGKKLMEVYDTVLAKEGRDGITFEPRLESLTKNPDVSPNSDTAPPLLLTHMVKMVYGKEPISDWPKVIEEWKSKGGNDVVKEATDKFNKKEGITMPRR
ncbi:extracellular solute-binding protein [Paenibacillus flagellatus]|uniref:ABC transporter substrate-binding protein n=1 Tax=Paenibacillus flagellatus TaxID=2211139 RepID=A0A2V5K509_9BACL|nr:extracellular solute-binding protein [Paenibacillus flagellatus]PYI54318.1 ABC transporter substrate-binding protein [Paenibacillus flagellatus]